MLSNISDIISKGYLFYVSAMSNNTNVGARVNPMKQFSLHGLLSLKSHNAFAFCRLGKCAVKSQYYMPLSPIVLALYICGNQMKNNRICLILITNTL